MFSFKIVVGDKDNPISGPGSTVISRSSANKYFANEYPVGKILEVNDISVKVTGVMEEVPENNHFNGNSLTPQC